MFGLEIVEGQDEPDVIRNKKKNKHGPTTGLLLRLTKSLWETGKFVFFACLMLCNCQ